jgi:anti-anti-sigma factor
VKNCLVIGIIKEPHANELDPERGNGVITPDGWKARCFIVHRRRTRRGACAMGMTDYQYITYKNVDGIAVVNFLETVSMFEGDKVKGVSDELLDMVESKRFTKMLLNLSNAHFVSSAMLAHLVKLNRKMQEVKGKIRLCCLRPVIQDAFRVSNFDRIFEIFPDEAAALKKF